MQVSEYRIVLPDLKPEGLRIVQVSDSHFGKKISTEENNLRMLDILDTVKPLNPDVIAVTGDLVSRNADGSAVEFARLTLSELSKMAQVLYVYGNHETTLPKDMQERLDENLKKLSVHVLNNSSVTIGDVNFYGYVLPNSCYKNENGTYFGLEECTASEIRIAVGECSGSPSVLLAHNPNAFDAYAQWGADVVLSGHVHGGIVRLPFLGGILSPERRFFPKFTKGCYQSGKATMIVSAGIGKLRINNPAEIVCVDLVRDACLK